MRQVSMRALLRTPLGCVLRVIPVLSLGLGCAAPSGEPFLADQLVAAPGATGEGVRDPLRAVNGVRGAGANAGSLDVYSLSPGADAYVVLGFSGRVVTNGPGADLVVFENPFVIGSGPSRFMDPLVVEVSRDGERWVAFPHAFTGPDGARWSSNPAHWQGFAGITPVLLHDEDAPGDPFDPLAAGGDAFDLDTLPADPEGDAIRREGFLYVRLTSARQVINPETGAAFPHDPLSDGPDIDGVYAR